MRTLTFTRAIGTGAFGTVYLAELSSQQGFRRPVAVKLIHSEQAEAEMFLSRIRDEARLLGLLQDDAILKVLDMVRIADRDAVIMEFIDGLDLDTLVKAGTAPPPRAIAELGSAVAGGLSRAHLATHPTTGAPLNVIHRDVKPANIMVTRSGGVKLLDFGIARARFDARESQTGQLVLGTLNYMAPEYIVTGDVSPAADVYGLGLALWEVATGSSFGQPKVRRNAHERRLDERLEALPAECAELGPLLRTMLAWDPRDRPAASVAEGKMMDAADALSGMSLRSWSRRVLPDVLAERSDAPDPDGLVGTAVQIGAPSTPNPEQAPTEVASRPELVLDPGEPTHVVKLSEIPGLEDTTKVDKSLGTAHTVSTSRADLALTSSSSPLPPHHEPHAPAEHSRNSATSLSPPIPWTLILAGATGGLVAGILVVLAAAFLLLR